MNANIQADQSELVREIANLIKKEVESTGKNKYGLQKSLDLASMIVANKKWASVIAQSKSNPARQEQSSLDVFVKKPLFDDFFVFISCTDGSDEEMLGIHVTPSLIQQLKSIQGKPSRMEIDFSDFDEGSVVTFKVCADGAMEPEGSFSFSDVDLPRYRLSIEHLLTLARDPHSCFDVGFAPFKCDGDKFSFYSIDRETLNDFRGPDYLHQEFKEKYEFESVLEDVLLEDYGLNDGDFVQLFEDLLSGKKEAQETYLNSVLMLPETFLNN